MDQSCRCRKGNKASEPIFGLHQSERALLFDEAYSNERTQEYYATCLLGCETDTYDSEGKRVRVAPWHHITREKVEATLPKFTGEISQTPPM